MKYDTSRLLDKERSFLATLVQLATNINVLPMEALSSAMCKGLKHETHVITTDFYTITKLAVIRLLWDNNKSICYTLCESDFDKIIAKFKLKVIK